MNNNMDHLVALKDDVYGLKRGEELYFFEPWDENHMQVTAQKWMGMIDLQRVNDNALTTDMVLEQLKHNGVSNEIIFTLDDLYRDLKNKYCGRFPYSRNPMMLLHDDTRPYFVDFPYNTGETQSSRGQCNFYLDDELENKKFLVDLEVNRLSLKASHSMPQWKKYEKEYKSIMKKLEAKTAQA
ncbi:MAG: hypothetical protein ACRCST_13510 [Turicibacter sp.]